MDATIASGGHGEGGAAALSEEEQFNDRKVRLGMGFIVLADVLFVVYLMVTYPWERAYNVDGGWFPYAGMNLPNVAISLGLVLLIVASAIFFFLGYLGIRAGNQAVIRICMLISTLLVLVTLVGQIVFMGAQQFAAADGTFADTWALFTGYHIYHLFWAAFLGIGITNRAFHGRYTKERHTGVVTIGYFWYWAALTPVLFYVLMLVLPPK
ncbi:MAG: cytochrome c oxidase subunit 3 [Ktedonobacterales bacterium]